MAGSTASHRCVDIMGNSYPEVMVLSPQASSVPPTGTSSPSSLMYICPGYHTDVTILYALCDMKNAGKHCLRDQSGYPQLTWGCYRCLNQIGPLRMEGGLENKQERENPREQSQPVSCQTTIVSASLASTLSLLELRTRGQERVASAGRLKC